MLCTASHPWSKALGPLLRRDGRGSVVCFVLLQQAAGIVAVEVRAWVRLGSEGLQERTEDQADPRAGAADIRI